MKQLCVYLHFNKRWFDSLKRSFDFLGFRISPVTQNASLCNNLVQYYKKGVEKKRTGQYLRRWLGWTGLSKAVIISILLLTDVNAAVSGNNVIGAISMTSVSGGAETVTCGVDLVSRGQITFAARSSYEAWAETFGGGADTTINQGFNITTSAADNLDFDSCNYTVHIDFDSGSDAFSASLEGGPTQELLEGNNSYRALLHVDMDTLRAKPFGVRASSSFNIIVLGEPKNRD